MLPGGRGPRAPPPLARSSGFPARFGRAEPGDPDRAAADRPTTPPPFFLRQAKGTAGLFPEGSGTATTAIGYKDKGFIKRTTKAPDGASTSLLTNVEQLGLLSKLEGAGLLSAAESAGLSLSFIESTLPLVEKLGLASAAVDRGTPGLLQALGLGLWVAGPAAVYFLPDDSTGLIAAQVVLAGVTTWGGAAAIGGAALLKKLQS